MFSRLIYGLDSSNVSMGSLAAAVCGCVTRATTRWHHPKVYSWSSILITRCSHYDVLGVPPNATKKDIKAAFIDKSKKYHPDRNSDPNAKTLFNKCAEAYEILGKEKSRTDYDATLRKPSYTYDPQQYTQAPDPFQASSTGFRTRTGRTYPTASSNRYRGFERDGMHPFEDIYMDMGAQRRAETWKNARDKKNTHQMNMRDAMKKQNQMWRDIFIFIVVLFVLLHTASGLLYRSRELQRKALMRERRELAKLRKLSEKSD